MADDSIPSPETERKTADQAYKAAWYQKNRARILASRKARYWANPTESRAKERKRTRPPKSPSQRQVANAKARERYAANVEAHRAAGKRWRDNNRDQLKERDRIRYYSTRRTDEQVRRNKKRSKEWYGKHRDEVNQKAKDRRASDRAWATTQYRRTSKRTKERYKTDPAFSLGIRLRRRLYMAIKGGQKSGSAVRDLGCSLEEFLIHIERQFAPRMSWNNWGKGKGKWHLDHIRPLSSFDLTDQEQFRMAVHFTNYRPLWSGDNLAKGARMTLLL